MLFERNKSLKEYNTFGVDVNAKIFSKVNSFEELKEVISSDLFKTNKFFIVGGGSNLLFTEDFEGHIIKVNIKGINIISESKNDVLISVNAGEIWDDFVTFAAQKDYRGVENLALIPGTVGAAPIQNIGAYGVEVQDVIEEVTSVEINSAEIKKIKKENCNFAYRDSIFKNELKNKVVVTSVLFRLNKKSEFNLNYGSLSDDLKSKQNLTAFDVAEVVKKIRNSKLPDIKSLGNAGSFFKNPVVTLAQSEEIKLKYENVPMYPVDEKHVKIPAGWLIDKAGLKGFRKGETGTYKNQALVIVNYGSATGNEIKEFSEFIQNKVFEKFNIKLSREVNLI